MSTCDYQIVNLIVEKGKARKAAYGSKFLNVKQGEHI